MRHNRISLLNGCAYVSLCEYVCFAEYGFFCYLMLNHVLIGCRNGIWHKLQKRTTYVCPWKIVKGNTSLNIKDIPAQNIRDHSSNFFLTIGYFGARVVYVGEMFILILFLFILR